MSNFASFRRPLTIAAALTASIAIVACNPTPAPTVTVSSVAVTAPVTTLAINATTTAKAVVTGTNTPAQTVTWTSSAPAVATVDAQGVVVAKTAGSTVIKATSTVDNTKSGQVTITVTPAAVIPTVTTVVVTVDKPSIMVGEITAAKAVVTGTNSPAQTVTWTSSAPAVATVDPASGAITAKAVGTTTITGTSTVDGTKTGTAVLTVTAAPVQPGTTTAKINFQKAGTVTPAGYTPNTGSAYTAASMTGWVTEDSAGTANPVALDLTGNARSRDVDGTNVIAGGDPRQYSQIQMQCGTPTSGNTCIEPATNTSGAFEYKVVNGKYNVTVSVGDADLRNLNSSHSINIEGVNAISGFVPTASNLFKTSPAVTVTVTDGKLTIDAKGGKNTKLNYVDIVPAN